MNQMGSNLAAVNLGVGRTAKAIALGYDHTCALLDDNTVKCWGNNDYGQLGYGDTTTRGKTSGDMAVLAPINLGTGRTAIAISAGYAYTCAILDNKQVKCWGYNGDGELGLGDIRNRGNLPDQMGNDLPYVDLGSGHSAKLIRTGSATCVLLNDDTVKCWGYNSDGDLGLGNINHRGDNPNEMGDDLPSIDFGTRRVQTIAVGGDGGCALFDSGAVTCWGNNGLGQLGQGHMNNLGDNENEMGATLLNINLGSGHTAKAISIFYHACAILDDDSLKCWGGNYLGQLGYGDTSQRGDEGGEMGDDLLPVNLGNDLFL
jgi:alpha-tubulin suppressor-like RCC1 family protein